MNFNLDVNKTPKEFHHRFHVKYKFEKNRLVKELWFDNLCIDFVWRYIYKRDEGFDEDPTFLI